MADASTTRTGETPNGELRWKPAASHIGRPTKCHTFATLALAHGASIDDVATVMGHDDIAVAYRYYRKCVKLMADRLRLTLDQIGASDDSVQHDFRVLRPER